jgi:hypothetical protein
MMVGLWMVMKAQGYRVTLAAEYAAVYCSRKLIKPGTLRLKTVILRLIAMYTIPYVHPLASLTSISHREAASPGESVARKT